jgi:hypothetical protein
MTNKKHNPRIKMYHVKLVLYDVISPNGNLSFKEIFHISNDRKFTIMCLKCLSSQRKMLLQIGTLSFKEIVHTSDYR